MFLFYFLPKWVIRTGQSGEKYLLVCGVKWKFLFRISFFLEHPFCLTFLSLWIKVPLRSHFHQRYIHLKKNLPTKRKILKSQDITAKVKEHMCSVYSLAKLKLIQVVFFVISRGKKIQKNWNVKMFSNFPISSGIKSEVPCQSSPISVAVAINLVTKLVN